MSSLAEIQQLRKEIEEIKQLLDEVEPRLVRTDANLGQQVRLLTVSMGLARKVLGTENIPEGIERDLRDLQTLIAELLYLRTVYLATMTTMGPVGLALLALGALGSAVSISHRTRG